MQTIQDLLNSNLKKELLERHKYVTKEFQDYGNRLAYKLGNMRQRSMYIKLAKDKPRALLEQALSFTSDYPNANDKARIFLWKLKELEKERYERLVEKNSNQRIILLPIDQPLTKSLVSFKERYTNRSMVDPKDIDAFIDGEYQKCLVGKMDLRKAVSKYLSLWNWQGTLDQFIEYWIDINIDLNNEVIKTIDRLDRSVYKVYICYNCDSYLAEFLEKKLSQVYEFDGFLFSHSLRLIMKDSKFFNKVLNHFFVLPKQIYYIDSNEKNLYSAEKVGINIYHYPKQGIDEIISDASI